MQSKNIVLYLSNAEVYLLWLQPLCLSKCFSNCLEKEVEINVTIYCAFLENNNYIIVDYKLGFLNETNKKLENYKNQLKLYKYALEKITNVKVKECILYSLVDGRTLDFKFCN